MKTTGRTNDGNYIVEMTDREVRLFNKLSQAVEGRTMNAIEWIDSPGMISMDFEGTFGAIVAWTIAKFYINEMRQYVDRLQNTIDKGTKL